MKFIDEYRIAKLLDMETAQVKRLVRQHVLPQPVRFGARVERWEESRFIQHLQSMAKQQQRKRQS